MKVNYIFKQANQNKCDKELIKELLEQSYELTKK